MAYQDDIKRFSELSFFECLNVRYDAEAKWLISNAITANYTPSLLFQFNSSVILNKVKLSLISTEMIRNEICTISIYLSCKEVKYEYPVWDTLGFKKIDN